MMRQDAISLVRGLPWACAVVGSAGWAILKFMDAVSECVALGILAIHAAAPSI